MSKEISVKIAVVSQSERAEMQLPLTQAVEEITTQYFGKGRWAYIGTTPFTFNANNTKDTAQLEKDQDALRALLLDLDPNLEVSITNASAGG